MEKKSNDDKYKDAVYKNGSADNLFRLPILQASCIFKYLDSRTKFNAFRARKGWAQQINELELPQKRQEYLKYFMWYVYGFGNAERLCKIVDDVLNELDKNKDNIIEGNDDKNKKFLLWHMVLLDILNIKMSDLKLDFDKEKSKSVEEAIKNCLLSNKSIERRNDFIDTDIMPDYRGIISDYSERLLWEYSRQVFPEFKNLQVELGKRRIIHIDVDTAELLGRIFACFFKVSFYQMKKVEDSNTAKSDIDKDNREICQEHKNKIYNFNYLLQDEIFDKLKPKVKITSSIAAYLFKTEELETWFHYYNKDFFSFFCNPDYFICGDDGESSVEFFAFAFYLNKIKSFETRYQENSDEFWKTFYTDIVKKGSYRGNEVLKDITSFISQVELKDEMSKKIDKNKFWIYMRSDRKYLFNHKEPIDLEKNYFEPIIIRFCGKKDLKENVIQSISEVIENKNIVEHEDKTKTKLASNPVQNNLIASNEINFKDGDESRNKDLTNKAAQPIFNVIESKDVVDHTGELKTNVVSNPVKNNLIASNKINLVDENKISDTNLDTQIENKSKQNITFRVVNESLITPNKINLANKSKMINASNKLNGKNKVGFWQHFLFGLFLALTCLSLFLCFKFSLGFLTMFFISLIICLYLGFKNYCRGCCCALNIKTPAIDQGGNSLDTINSNEQPQTSVDIDQGGNSLEFK